jgi:hypothetical protein
MTYTIQQDGFIWEIPDAGSTHRWRLRVKRGETWETTASYISPGAASLAVASGDTGVADWDLRPRRATDFRLSHWSAQAPVE